MAKLFGLIMFLIVLYLGMTIYTGGINSVYDEIFSPITPSDTRETPIATHLTAGAQEVDAPNATSRRRVPVTTRVRERVTADLEEGARRRGY